jgi:alpha-L-fucosidase
MLILTRWVSLNSHYELAPLVNMFPEGTEQFAHHNKKYGGPEKFRYKNFIPVFTAESFNPEE